MDTIISLVVFILVIVGFLLADIPLILAIAVGWFIFIIAALRRKCSVKELAVATYKGLKDSMIVVAILLIIGMLTASWRSGGTILFFVYYGMKLISPPLFILLSFLLSSLLSYAIGTSFGVVGTMGVIFMAIARSGGANEILTAGAVMSGIYFGDCCSPAASSMALTAALCHVDAYPHSVRLLKMNLLPMGLCVVLYGIFSYMNPIASVDENLLSVISSEYNVSMWVAIPAVLMLALPIFKVNTKIAMVLSIVSAGIVSIVLQKMPVLDFLKCLIVGYTTESEGLGSILKGGGLVSMLNVCGILAISSTYSEIFKVSGLLDGLSDVISEKMKKFGSFPVMLVSSIVFGMIFCNQTIAVLMCASVLEQSYDKMNICHEQMAVEIGCSAIDLCGLIPWCIACSVPLGIMGVGVNILPYAFLLYLLPITYFVRDRMGKTLKYA